MEEKEKRRKRELAAAEAPRQVHQVRTPLERPALDGRAGARAGHFPGRLGE